MDVRLRWTPGSATLSRHFATLLRHFATPASRAAASPLTVRERIRGAGHPKKNWRFPQGQPRLVVVLARKRGRRLPVGSSYPYSRETSVGRPGFCQPCRPSVPETDLVPLEERRYLWKQTNYRTQIHAASYRIACANLLASVTVHESRARAPV